MSILPQCDVTNKMIFEKKMGIVENMWILNKYDFLKMWILGNLEKMWILPQCDQQDDLLTVTNESRLDFTGSSQISRSTSIDTRVIGNGVHNVQSYITKVMKRPESMSNNDRCTILEPLHLQVGVSNGF